jgi:hypothetical protein
MRDKFIRTNKKKARETMSDNNRTPSDEIRERAEAVMIAGEAEGRTRARAGAMGHVLGITPIDAEGRDTSDPVKFYKIREGVVGRILKYAERNNLVMRYDPQTKRFA